MRTLSITGGRVLLDEAGLQPVAMTIGDGLVRAR